MKFCYDTNEKLPSCASTDTVLAHWFGNKEASVLLSIVRILTHDPALVNRLTPQICVTVPIPAYEEALLMQC